MKTLPKAIKQRRNPDYVWHFTLRYSNANRFGDYSFDNEFELRGFIEGVRWHFELISLPHQKDEQVCWVKHAELFERLTLAADVAYVKYSALQEWGGYDLNERPFSRAISRHVYSLATAHIDEKYALRGKKAAREAA